MKERPILFSAPMVRAILDGSKTQTRRVVKPQPVDRGGGSLSISYAAGKMNHMGPAGFMLEKLAQYGCPYGKTGDLLWVRESFAKDCDGYVYKATCPWWDGLVKKKPSIHMPRSASRITLEITDVRVERLHDISEDDASAEGCPLPKNQRKLYADRDDTARGWFRQLWKSINGPDSWDANPWVWAIGFKRVEGGAS